MASTLNHDNPHTRATRLQLLLVYLSASELSAAHSRNSSERPAICPLLGINLILYPREVGKAPIHRQAILSVRGRPILDLRSDDVG